MQSSRISSACTGFDCTIIDRSQSILAVQQSEQLSDMLTPWYTIEVDIWTTMKYGTRLSKVLEVLNDTD